MAWLPILQLEGIKPEWENIYNQLVSGGQSQSTTALDIEEETSEDKVMGEKLESKKSMMHLN